MDDDIDGWVDLERGLDDGHGTGASKRALQDIDLNAGASSRSGLAGTKRQKVFESSPIDDDELLEYMQQHPGREAGCSAIPAPQGHPGPASPLGRRVVPTSPPHGIVHGVSTASPVRSAAPPAWETSDLQQDDDLQQGPDPGMIMHPCLNPLGIEGDVMPVTGSSGARVFCSLQAEATSSDCSSYQSRHRRLLAQPWSVLQKVLEDRTYDYLIRKAQAEEAEADRLAQAEANGASQGTSPAALWVDKYCPQSFLDLLSDEQINRVVVRWVKSWDTCVFQRTSGGQAGVAPQRSFKPELRPEQKVLLLCGAPGLGKTTLAHVVARHCNYQPMEINASDSRSAEGLHNWLTDAAQTHSVTGDGRPNCIILDEVDGATGGAEGRGTIAALLKLVTAAGGGKPARGKSPPGKARQAADDEDSDGPEDGDGPGRMRQGKGKGAGQRRKAATRPLCRPVIAICNNLYAPALRPLRAVSKVVQFKTPTAERITSRLRIICAAEGLTVDRQALNALVEVTRSDIRACLNALQFLSRRTKRVTLSAINSLGIARKDVTESAFTVWGQLLTSRRQNASRQQGGSSETERLLNMLQDLGDDDLVFGGLHENMLRGRFMDTHMTRTAAAAAHLAHADVLMRQCGRRGDFSLMRYLPASALCVRACVAGPTRPELQWPKQQGEAYRRRTANVEMLHSWHLNVNPTIRCCLSISAAVQEVLPALLQSVCRPLRPVAVRLLSPEERSSLTTLVVTMADYAIGFDMSPNFTPAADVGALALLPPVHALCNFPGIPASHRAPPLPTQQVIAQELQAETIRRREQVRLGQNDQRGTTVCAGHVGDTVSPTQEVRGSQAATKAHPLTVAQRAKEATTGSKRIAKPARKGNWLEQLQGKSAASKKPQLPDQHTDASDGGAAQRWPVLYKFSQGYTNAVRRTVRMKDLL